MWPQLESLQHLLGLLAFFAGPCLAILALHGWAKRLRSSLPRWRKAVGLASTGILGLNWLFIVTLASAGLLGVRTADILFGNAFMSAVLLSSSVALVMSTGLKGSPRLQAAGASILVFTFFWGSMYY